MRGFGKMLRFLGLYGTLMMLILIGLSSYQGNMRLALVPLLLVSPITILLLGEWIGRRTP